MLFDNKHYFLSIPLAYHNANTIKKQDNKFNLIKEEEKHSEYLQKLSDEPEVKNYHSAVSNLF